MRHAKVIALSGGIGSGKSVVSRCLETMGFGVYDSDSNARRLVDSSPDIIAAIARDISRDAVNLETMVVDRATLGEIVFNDESMLRRLNEIVHAAVKDDIVRWVSCHDGSRPVFVETAILYQSGLDRMVDEVWEVFAPVEVRIQRVMSRNGLTRGQVLARINSQDAYRPDVVHPQTRVIINDGLVPVVPAIIALLEKQ